MPKKLIEDVEELELRVKLKTITQPTDDDEHVCRIDISEMFVNGTEHTMFHLLEVFTKEIPGFDKLLIEAAENVKRLQEERRMREGSRVTN